MMFLIGSLIRDKIVKNVKLINLLRSSKSQYRRQKTKQVIRQFVLEFKGVFNDIFVFYSVFCGLLNAVYLTFQLIYRFHETCNGDALIFPV